MNKTTFYSCAVAAMVGINALAIATIKPVAADTLVHAKADTTASTETRTVSTNTIAHAGSNSYPNIGPKEWRSAGKATNGYRKPGTGVDVNYAIESMEQVGDSATLVTEVQIGSSLDELTIELRGQGIDMLSASHFYYQNVAAGTIIPIPADVLALTEGEQTLVMTIATKTGTQSSMDVIGIPIEIGDISKHEKPQATTFIDGEEVVAMQLNIN